MIVGPEIFPISATMKRHRSTEGARAGAAAGHIPPKVSSSCVTFGDNIFPRTFLSNLQCYAFSADSAKIVHLVRHGQGLHNVEAALRGSAAYKNE